MLRDGCVINDQFNSCLNKGLPGLLIVNSDSHFLVVMAGKGCGWVASNGGTVAGQQWLIRVRVQKG